MKYSQVLLPTLAYSGKKDDPTAWLPASPPHKLGHWTHEASPHLLPWTLAPSCPPVDNSNSPILIPKSLTLVDWRGMVVACRAPGDAGVGRARERSIHA